MRNIEKSDTYKCFFNGYVFLNLVSESILSGNKKKIVETTLVPAIVEFKYLTCICNDEKSDTYETNIMVMYF